MEHKVETLIRRAPRIADQFAGFRRFARKKIALSVVVRDDEGLQVPLESVDLSQSGIFLKSSILFDVGQKHTLEFFDLYGHRVSVKAEVVRVSGETAKLRRAPSSRLRVAGMGYEFLETDDRTRSQLQSLIGL